MVKLRQPTNDPALLDAAEIVHVAWNDALARKDANALARCTATMRSLRVRWSPTF